MSMSTSEERNQRRVFVTRNRHQESLKIKPVMLGHALQTSWLTQTTVHVDKSQTLPVDGPDYIFAIDTPPSYFHFKPRGGRVEFHNRTARFIPHARVQEQELREDFLPPAQDLPGSSEMTSTGENLSFPEADSDSSPGSFSSGISTPPGDVE